MPLSSFATVELHLIMHACDKHSLLALARCCRATLAAASEAFAWRHLNPLPLDFSADSPSLGAALSGSLPRRCDVHLRWCLPSAESRAVAGAEDGAEVDYSEPAAEELAALAAVPRIRGLDLRPRGLLGLAAVAKLLAHPALSGLTALLVDAGNYLSFGHRRADGTSAGLLSAAAAHCPLLHTLRYYVDYVEDDAYSQDMLAPVPGMAHLTDLRLDSFAASADRTLLRVGECRALRSLRLQCINDEFMQPILTSPSLASLHRLTLVGARGLLRSPAAIDWRACLANLPGLRSLALLSCRGVEAILQAVLGMSTAPSPGLRLLAVLALEARDLSLAAERGAQLPPVPLLRTMLERMPQITALRMSMPPLAAYEGMKHHAYTRAPVSREPAQLAAEWHSAHAALTQLAQEQTRMHLRLE